MITADLTSRMEDELKQLTIAREQAQLALNGIENQIYAIRKLLNPETTTNAQDSQGQETGSTPEVGKI